MKNKSITVEGIAMVNSSMMEGKDILVKGIDHDTNEEVNYRLTITDKQLTPFLFMSLYDINKTVFKIPVLQELERVVKIKSEESKLNKGNG